MKTEIFTQIGLDSGALGVLGSIVHPLTEKGEYRGTVIKDGQDASDFTITVNEDGKTGLSIDLATISTNQGNTDDSCKPCKTNDQHYSLKLGGHVVFHASKGSQCYAAQLSRVNEKKRTFNSQLIGKDDLFAASILRPGKYKVTVNEKYDVGSLIVTYPPMNVKKAYIPDDPLKIEISEKAMSPEQAKIGPAQGIIFHPESDMRIVIKLIEPDDGGKHRSKKPRYSIKKTSGAKSRICSEN
ncbi:MAG: hypothetical protein L3J00_03400 [Thiomicrorhabdus sp.]|nr:hypothetical protein [Thiomicrorhabdus sp.]